MTLIRFSDSIRRTRDQDERSHVRSICPKTHKLFLGAKTGLFTPADRVREARRAQLPRSIFPVRHPGATLSLLIPLPLNPYPVLFQQIPAYG